MLSTQAPVGPSGLASHLLPDTVLYLPRPQGSSRAVENEDELLRAIEAHLVPGIKLKKFIHVPGSHLSEDAAQFQTAKVVIGPHGGAWANIVFMPPGGQVIEFIPMGRLSRANPKANLRPCYYGLARACRLGYWMLEPRNFDFDRPQKMQVSVDEVLNGLRHIGVLRDGFAAQQVAQVEGGAQRTTRHSGLLPGSRFISGEMRKEKQGRITSHPISGAVRRRYRRVHGAE